MCPPQSYRPAPLPPDAASVFALLVSGPYSRVGAAPARASGAAIDDDAEPSAADREALEP
jgi:hypothetical protein